MTSEAFRYDLLTIILLFVILLTIFVIYFPLVATIVLGMTVAIVLEPLHRRLSRRFPARRSA
ncbi:MAG: hypothetical protein LUO91_04895, partial [Methanomicrobiales archaeon]|nr:hypothetical protein [Methanomicrobiales archaeon]